MFGIVSDQDAAGHVVRLAGRLEGEGAAELARVLADLSGIAQTSARPIKPGSRPCGHSPRRDPADGPVPVLESWRPVGSSRARLPLPAATRRRATIRRETETGGIGRARGVATRSSANTENSS
jgi:hypothetical protein